MGPRVPQSAAELESQLQEQLQFIQASSLAFDTGFEGEAKRLATAIRVLAHDTKSSKSLLGQLGLKHLLFVDTAHDWSPTNLLTHMGLVGMRVATGGSKYVALLGDSPRGVGVAVPFRHWWEKVVFVDDRRETLTRGELILAIANQDGGAHVDPSLNETYARLSRQNSMGWVETGTAGTKPMEGAHLAAVRQIAFELVTSLKERRSVPAADAMRSAKSLGRNDRCHCGSGKKFKKCHGAPAA